jgi:hypothetical protein
MMLSRFASAISPFCHYRHAFTLTPSAEGFLSRQLPFRH